MVVQTLVEPSVAGVMFTRHPEAGDPSRLLITANYGLGEVGITLFPLLVNKLREIVTIELCIKRFAQDHLIRVVRTR